MQTKKQQGRKSPYVRYGKVPYLYSPAYQAWRSAVKTGNKDRIQQADEAWYRQIMTD